MTNPTSELGMFIRSHREQVLQDVLTVLDNLEEQADYLARYGHPLDPGILSSKLLCAARPYPWDIRIGFLDPSHVNTLYYGADPTWANDGDNVRTLTVRTFSPKDRTT